MKRSTDGAHYTTIASGMTMDHLYTDVGLAPGTTYHYVVSAMVDGVETANSAPAKAMGNQLPSGTIIGSTGAYNGLPRKEFAFDGSIGSYYDAANPSGDWAGLDLGVPNVIAKIGYCPRANNAGRMMGGRFEGSNTPDFGSGAKTLFTISSAPPDTTPKTMTYQTVSNPGAFRYVRYLGPHNASCNVADLEFYGYASPSAAPLHTHYDPKIALVDRDLQQEFARRD